MKTFTLTTVYILLSSLLLHANTLLQSPQTGTPFSTGLVNEIEVVSNETDVALIIANNSTGELYAVDIDDNDPADSATNAVTVIPDFPGKIEAALGISDVMIHNFEVNLISRSVYVLVEDMGNGDRYVMVVKDNGADISTLDLSNVTYATIDFNSASLFVQDITWDGNTLYIAAGGWSLDGEVAQVTAPFEHNTSTTNRTTSMFKSNWFPQDYYTTAPLEKWDYVSVKGEARLVGVTTCAPGFSLKPSELSGTDTLKVVEHFDVVTMPPDKVVAVTQNDTSYLFDLHFPNQLVRIGEKFIDGSRVDAAEINENATMVRDFSGNPGSGLTEEEVKIYQDDTLEMIAYYTDYELLVLDNQDTMKRFKIGTQSSSPPPPPTAISQVAGASISVYPNPAADQITIQHPTQFAEHSYLVIYALDGRKVLKSALSAEPKQVVPLKGLSKGNYVVSVWSDHIMVSQERIILQ